MKQIPLTQGKVALVDDTDYNELSQYKWCAQKTQGNFYATRKSPRINGKQSSISMHRQILQLEKGDKREADHKDHNTLDNRRANIRICTHQQNQKNQKRQLNTTSNFKGVCWYKLTKKWLARIMINGERKCLGYFRIEKEAALAYDVAAKKYHREFAYLNFRGVE